MKKRLFKYIISLLLLLFGTGFFSLNADFLTFNQTLPEIELISPEAEGDTIPPRYPVAKTTPEYEDILKQSPADLKTPENVSTKVEYDIRTGQYKIVTRIGDMELGTPLRLTPEEYQDYSMKQSLNSYFRQKNAEAFDAEGNQRFNLTDLQFDLGPAQRIFGPGGVRVRTQGTAQVTMGLKRSTTQDPTLPESSRSRTYFNFDESVQLNVQASVGTKVNFDMNYNTETSFDFDSKKLKLAYTGDEDEIIKSLEAGNVSMTTSNSLINGGAALFGMKADLQFGKLRVKALAAQQESQSRTVNSRGGAQTKDFEIPVDQYDENRHFFLGHYFRDIFDGAMTKLPYINTSIQINRIEVWVTNKSGNYDNARNVVAFADLGETTEVNKPIYQTSLTSSVPYNTVNNLYNELTTTYSAARDISQVTPTLSGVFEGGREFEKVESARLLNPSEYVLNEKLGYISLRSQLQSDEVLAVAFEYTYGGQNIEKVYKVGEFSTDNTENTSTTLYVKLLKGTASTPSMTYWDLMMKNVYSLGAYSVQKDKFQLDILYQSDSIGTYLNYLPEGKLSETTLLRVMGLDRLNSNNDPYPDGFFDFVEGYTILTDNGRVIFPSVEPFGSHLRGKIGNDMLADKYVYQELYDTTLVAARQIAEKNKFILRGKYRASSASEIDLGATNVARGSVRVTAGGVALTENVDYTVDYISGIVTIINENVISSNSAISVNLENQSVYSMQRKTMLGLDLNYDFSDKLTVGGTVMHLSEMPLTTKTTYGDESVKNTLWGLNLAYKSESQLLTNMLDKIPLLSLTQPSHISFDAEFAHLIAGHYENKYTGAYSYIDDFESAQSGFDLTNPYSWQIASTPYQDHGNPLFPEAGKINDIDYGKNRSLFAWYYIDGMFTRKNSTLMPQYLKNNKDLLSNHYSRAVTYQEIFPNKDMGYNESSTLQVLNVAYYPEERGPYNLDAEGMNPDGTLSRPESRWGGMMRKIDQSNFESANVEYIEFWLMDPFIYNQTGQGGDLYFNLGEISEDILKDGKKFYENGLPVDGDLSKVDTTVWGRVPKQLSTVYAFDNTDGTLKLQDVGLDGLSSDDEKSFPAYSTYLQQLQSRIDGSVWARWQGDPFSPVNDPSGDDFHHYRGSDYDSQELDILTRYKRYNGTEGNSSSNEDSSDRYNTAAKKLPDVEDINQDNNLNENEKYYEYKVSLKPSDLDVGRNHIVDKRDYTLKLENGKEETVTWYQFKIPVKQYDNRIGNIQDFTSIRFMRMYMTGFKDETFLRFGTFQLVRGDWRSYEQDLYGGTGAPAVDGQMEVFTVNIEENNQKDPVNYVLPPGVTRMTDPNQPQLTRQNEQSLAMKISGLAPQDAKAIYKTTSYDFRQYKRLQLFTHAEAFSPDPAAVQDQEFSAFIRLGSDYKNNYYEYEIPLKITPAGSYSTNSPTDQYIVWPESNMMDFRFQVLTDLKMARNRASRQGAVNINYNTVYSEADPDNMMNKISIVGNPSLAEVKVIMIGVRNNTSQTKNIEVWVNELRLTDFDEDGGWAANANLNIALSDLGTVNVGGRIETAGFGGLDQSLIERRMDDYTQFNVSTALELGKFFPEKAKVSLPLYYSYYEEKTKPKYNPLDQDILLSTALSEAVNKTEKDSILQSAQDKTVTKGIAFNNVRVDIKSETPMPYDPANFSVSYSYSETVNTNPETEYETTKDYRGSFSYNYTPYVKPFEPFRKLRNNSYTRYFRQLRFNYVPNSINFLTTMTRNYYELQLRDLAGVSNNNGIPVSFSQNFYWDRAFGMRWDFTNNLRTTFNSGTNARIEEPYVQVNRKLNPDAYQVWKDSVWKSIRDMGRPLAYDQTFTATYNLPFQFIPALNWVTTSANYTAKYTWDRSAILEDGKELGNTIQNQRIIDFQSSFNLLPLYNKNKFLRAVNQKFNQAGNTRNTNTARTQEKKPRPKVEKEVTLSTDSSTYLTHGLMTNRVNITARGADGKRYNIKYRIVNPNQVLITNRDTTSLQLTVSSLPPKTEEKWYKYAEYGSRVLMMVRRFNISYNMTDGMTLPGFAPEVGDIFGQKNSSVGMAPGLDFAFGRVNRGYIEKASQNNWLIYNYEDITPAYLQTSKNLNISVGLEPWIGLKIDLNASHLKSENTEIKFMFDGMPEQYGGNFTMTTIAVRSSFGGIGNLSNGYKSANFEKFVGYRQTIADRYDRMYRGSRYPGSGYMANNTYAGQDYVPGSVSENATDVLISSFLAAYTGKNPDKITLTPFPSLTSMLPNWRVTYEGLARIPVVKKYFKTLVLRHEYKGSYNVSPYSSHTSWTRLDGDMGFVSVEGDALPTPSSPYNISSVTISDGFTPLIGVDGTLLSNVTLSTQYRTNRNLNLNVSSYQIVESQTREFVVGLGYKMAEFNKILKVKPKPGFSNDLDMRLDFSYRKTLSLNRKIEDMTSQMTSGNVAKIIQFSANYAMSRALNMRVFYDMQINNPLLSSTAYPTTNTSFGVSMIFSLTQ